MRSADPEMSIRWATMSTLADVGRSQTGPFSSAPIRGYMMGPWKDRSWVSIEVYGLRGKGGKKEEGWKELCLHTEGLQYLQS